jgi:hypothetical protein
MHARSKANAPLGERACRVLCRRVQLVVDLVVSFAKVPWAARQHVHVHVRHRLPGGGAVLDGERQRLRASMRLDRGAHTLGERPVAQGCRGRRCLGGCVGGWVGEWGSRGSKAPGWAVRCVCGGGCQAAGRAAQGSERPAPATRGWPPSPTGAPVGCAVRKRLPHCALKWRSTVVGVRRLLSSLGASARNLTPCAAKPHPAANRWPCARQAGRQAGSPHGAAHQRSATSSGESSENRATTLLGLIRTCPGTTGLRLTNAMESGDVTNTSPAAIVHGPNR